MSQDDDADCVEHVWRLVGLVLGDGVQAEYECARPACDAVMVRLPGQPFADTV